MRTFIKVGVPENDSVTDINFTVKKKPVSTR